MFWKVPTWERSSVSLNYFQKFSNIFKYFHTFFTSMENGSNSKGCYFPEEIFRSVIIKMYRFIFSVKMCENIWKCLKICENMAFSNIFKHFQTYRWTLSICKGRQVILVWQPSSACVWFGACVICNDLDKWCLKTLGGSHHQSELLQTKLFVCIVDQSWAETELNGAKSFKGKCCC